MKKTLLAVSTATLTATGLHADGLDRSFQSVSSIFADNGTASVSFANVMPSVTGSDDLGNTYQVGVDFTRTELSYTRDFSNVFTLGLIVDQPFGVNVDYNTDPFTSNLGGTGADLSSEAVTVIGKFQIAPRFSMFGGVKFENVRADVQLNGQSYASAIAVDQAAQDFNEANMASIDSGVLGAALLGDTDARTAIISEIGLPAFAGLGGRVGGAATTEGSITNFLAAGGYDFRMDTDDSVGYVIGAAYEIPDIAFRLAATYHFEIDHTASTVESLFGNVTRGSVDYVTPQSFNLEFQSGIAADTLLTASYRWTDFSAVDVVPTVLRSDLVNLEDGHRATLGVARRFTDNFSGSVTLIYEPEDSDDLVSPLGPTNGLWGLSVGGQYTFENMKLSGGINYSKLGDARAEIGGIPRATFTNNQSLAVGVRAEFTF